MTSNHQAATTDMPARPTDARSRQSQQTEPSDAPPDAQACTDAPNVASRQSEDTDSTPPQVDSAQSASALTRVLATAELFERILLETDERTLLLSQRVSSYFRDTIQKTPSLRRKLFFELDPTAPLRLNPILSDPKVTVRLELYQEFGPERRRCYRYRGQWRMLAHRCFIRQITICSEAHAKNSHGITADRDSIYIMCWSQGKSLPVKPQLPPPSTPGSWQEMYLTNHADVQIEWRADRHVFDDDDILWLRSWATSEFSCKFAELFGSQSEHAKIYEATFEMMGEHEQDSMDEMNALLEGSGIEEVISFKK